MTQVVVKENRKGKGGVLGSQVAGPIAYATMVGIFCPYESLSLSSTDGDEVRWFD